MARQNGELGGYSHMSNKNSFSITPAPTDEEVAAIVAAIEANLPTAGMVASPLRDPRSAWKFSGRWWARPGTSRRDRPWY
jgi:hypothetical protein